MEEIPNHQAVLYVNIHTFSYTEIHTVSDVHAHIQYDKGKRK